ncbi:deoxyhypusine hydroxylase-A-like [Olea europaea var. sylvestris]|uniref:deoxyhypusine hydroxylase-A-like n=1 Tax=Olea europaea var. sylvestris TaxID=158386 RepID=UPI000C1D42B7|nr:deoxyhypusine hydroxylase-A-like [Olea europaea var. sylvestris]
MAKSEERPHSQHGKVQHLSDYNSFVGLSRTHDFLRETLGAFGLESSVPVLKTSFESGPSKEVKESCELALNRIRELTNAKPNELRCFNLLEAAPLLFRPVPELSILFGEVLLNEDNSLYERCSALFSLRLYCLHPTSCTEEAISAIIESLYAESAVLRYHLVLVVTRGIDSIT